MPKLYKEIKEEKIGDGEKLKEELVDRGGWYSVMQSDGTVFEVMSSWTALTGHLGTKTTF